MYDLLFGPAAERYLKRLRGKSLEDAYRAVFPAIMKNPYIGTQKRDYLSGVYGFALDHQDITCETAYTIRKGNGQRVVVLLLGTRENFVPCA